MPAKTHPVFLRLEIELIFSKTPDANVIPPICARPPIKKIGSLSNLKNTGWVFAGTLSKKYQPDPKNEAGWGTFIEKNNLKSTQTLSLPTVWTFHEPEETPYIFTQTISDP